VGFVPRVVRAGYTAAVHALPSSLYDALDSAPCAFLVLLRGVDFLLRDRPSAFYIVGVVAVVWFGVRGILRRGFLPCLGRPSRLITPACCGLRWRFWPLPARSWRMTRLPCVTGAVYSVLPRPFLFSVHEFLAAGRAAEGFCAPSSCHLSARWRCSTLFGMRASACRTLHHHRLLYYRYPHALPCCLHYSCPALRLSSYLATARVLGGWGHRRRATTTLHDPLTQTGYSPGLSPTGRSSSTQHPVYVIPGFCITIGACSPLPQITALAHASPCRCGDVGIRRCGHMTASHAFLILHCNTALLSPVRCSGYCSAAIPLPLPSRFVVPADATAALEVPGVLTATVLLHAACLPRACRSPADHCSLLY